MQWMHPAFIFSVLEVENENAAAWNEVPAAKKSLAAFHAALSLFRFDQYQRNRGNQNCPGIIMGINPIPRIKVMVHPAPVIMLQLLSNTI